MPTNTLTDTRCRTAKASDKPQKLFDGHGLHLYVTPAGGKFWRMAYRLDGKPKTISLGEYPLVGLADARVKRDGHRATLAAGDDPMVVKRVSRGTLTLQQAAEQYWDGRQDVTDKYRAEALSGIKMHLGALLAWPVGSIKRDDLLTELMAMNKVGLFSYVRKVRMWVSQVFEWAVELGHCAINPAALIRPEKAFGKAETESFASLPLPEVGEFLARVALEGDLQSVRANLMLAYTWARTGELRKMRFDKIDTDLWRVEKKVMKKRRAHLVPLSRQALVLVTEQRSRTRGEFVWPGRSLDTVMSENSILYLIHRCGYKDRMTGHGWRTIASTWANESGFSPDAIEKQLAHQPDDETRAVYNMAEYLPERRRMMQAWADWLDLQHANAVSQQG
ncbi:MAG: integrase arm-type DNA-binding domain-containing protein [Pseudomonadota bacterium]